MSKSSNVSKRVLALLLTLLMTFCMLPGVLLAAPQNGENAVAVEWNYTGVSPAAAPATGGENQDGALLTNFQNTAPTFSTASLCLTNWTGSGEKYWQMVFSSKNFEDLAISLAQRSSGTGPRYFKLQYSLDGSQWSDVTGNEYDTNITTTSLAVTFNQVPLPSEIEGLDRAYLRLLLVSNVSSRAGSGSYAADEQMQAAGTSNLNNIVIVGKYVSGEPTLEKVAAVTADPAAGAIEQNAQIALACATPDALIKYSLNGASYIDYQEPFSVATLPATVEAYAIKDGMRDSDPATLTPSIPPVTPAATIHAIPAF